MSGLRSCPCQAGVGKSGGLEPGLGWEVPRSVLTNGRAAPLARLQEGGGGFSGGCSRLLREDRHLWACGQHLVLGQPLS